MNAYILTHRRWPEKVTVHRVGCQCKDRVRTVAKSDAYLTVAASPVAAISQLQAAWPDWPRDYDVFACA